MNLTRKTHPIVIYQFSNTLHQPSLTGSQSSNPNDGSSALLKRSGLGVGVGIAGTELTLVKKARAMGSKPSADQGIVVKRTVCSHCSVGLCSGCGR
jgi:formate dehydrogenase major subunit